MIPHPLISLVCRRFAAVLAGLAGLAIGCSAPTVPSRSTLEEHAPTHLDELLDEVEYHNPELPDSAPFVVSEVRGRVHRRAIQVVTPARLIFELAIPVDGRLDLAMGIGDGAQVPVQFNVLVSPVDPRAADERGSVVLDFTRRPGPRGWMQRSVDLSSFGGQTVALELAVSSDRSGTEAMWGTPIVSGSRRADRPNVILYVIDAAGAEYMSAYGYERPTTPFIEELAGRGALFERAYSNSSWTKLSTPSFLSSLQSSVLGGYRGASDRIPEGAIPLAERLHGAGYLTALFTTNPFAGMLTGLDRGVDWVRDARVEPISASSPALHEMFWEWRAAYPAGPFYVHFQTTDVHWPWTPVAPYAGRFVDETRRDEFYDWEQALATASGLERPQWLHGWRYPPEAFAATGIDKQAFFEAASGLYDETMLHNDARLRELVEALEQAGEWDNTVLIVASDHGSAHRLGLYDPVPPRSGPLFNPYRTRIPLVVVWPGHIEPGTRITAPVSMIDLVPTVLDLAELDAAELGQGQSLLTRPRG